jgi:hypothetical protein
MWTVFAYDVIEDGIGDVRDMEGRDARSAGQPMFGIARTVHSANQLEPSLPARKSTAGPGRDDPKLRAKVLTAVVRRQLPPNRA